MQALRLPTARPGAPPGARKLTKARSKVFTETEWDEAIKSAAATAVKEAPTGAAGDSNGAAAGAATNGNGSVFSDAAWEAYINRAPSMLKDLDEGADSAAATEDAGAADASGTASSGAGAGVFTAEQWEEGLRISAELQTAEARKAEVDAEIAGLQEEFAAVSSPLVGNAFRANWFRPAEAVNGRVAMVGFVLGVASEFSSATPLAGQLAAAPGTPLGLVAAVTAATYFQELSGNKRESSGFGPFGPQEEKINGRGAMIGVAAMLLIEAAQGKALF